MPWIDAFPAVGWVTAPCGRAIHLSDRKCHVWRVFLSSPVAQHLAAALSLEEVEKAQSIPNSMVRHRYTTGRNVLRHILSAYLPEFSPERIPLKRNPHGKLFVPPETHHLKFNVAHTNDVYVVAVARSREVGIDIESVGRTLKNVPALSWRWLHPSEAEKVGSSGVDFLASWVRKEAYVKALGLGISRGDLKSFRFNEDGQVIDRGDPRDWSFHEFSVISREHITDDATPRLSRNYIGCVALQGIDAKIDAWWTVGDADAQTAH